MYRKRKDDFVFIQIKKSLCTLSALFRISNCFLICLDVEPKFLRHHVVVGVCYMMVADIV